MCAAARLYLAIEMLGLSPPNGTEFSGEGPPDRSGGADPRPRVRPV
jgi:hypothetical protein